MNLIILVIDCGDLMRCSWGFAVWGTPYSFGSWLLR